MEQNKKELQITHVFDAPVELVFNAWTDPEILVKWYAPDGCTIEFKSLEVTENGSFHSCIHDPVHGDCWITGVYREVTFPEKLVFSMVLSNEAGESVGSLDAGKPEDWPKEIMTTVRFTPVGDQTELTIHQTVNEEEAKQTGAYQSWIKMFNILNRLISTSKI
ncbi:SRPBCC family protein [Pedobacter metabolipauper]|uniref:Uncharacterized protein YndB with AHSA1/START domain n=1 Tax=Pedobacter metabolipauper TaxID=425513 RepID=A0A4R6SXF4_9SPHI|nr:SRPBCC domain-containing protein [Pedobacter metabolipauper]TDQ11204.1 uncharacterized protein YndB with AHSA1/START domain [Pedobacter metabolipauper]